MTDPDLEPLAALWRRPDEAEQAMFEKMARRARLKARLIAYGDHITFVFMIAVFAVIVYRHRSPTSIALAIVLLGVVALLNWQRHIYRVASRTIDTSGRDVFLDTALAGARARLRTVMLGLYAAPLLILLAILFVICAEQGVSVDSAFLSIPQWIRSRRALTLVAILLLSFPVSFYYRRRIGREIEGLEKLKRDYEEERLLDEKA